MRKQIFNILLCMTLLFGLTGCDSNSSLKLNEIKKNGDWKATIKNVEYADSYCKVLNYNFLTSNTTYTKKDTEYVCTQEKPTKNDNKFLLFEIDLEYIGKKKISQNIEDFELNYDNGYKLNADTVYITSNKDSLDSWIYIAGEAVNHHEIDIDPLENTNFTIRGAFEINEKIEKDKDSSLILNLPFNFKYKVR